MPGATHRNRVPKSGCQYPKLQYRRVADPDYDQRKYEPAHARAQLHDRCQHGYETSRDRVARIARARAGPDKYNRSWNAGAAESGGVSERRAHAASNCRSANVDHGHECRNSTSRRPDPDYERQRQHQWRGVYSVGGDRHFLGRDQRCRDSAEPDARANGVSRRIPE